MPPSPIHFGTSGWRAIIADDFTFPNVRLAVTAIAEHVRNINRKHPVLLIAYDTRFFSEEFSLAAAEILADHGVESLLCDGPTPTPTVAYELRRRKLDGAINFTASHNPWDYNGLKLSGPDGSPALPEVTRDVEARAAKLAGQDFSRAPGAHSGLSAAIPRIAPRDEYLKRIAELVRFEKIGEGKIKIAYDGLHGCGAGYLDLVLADHGIAATTIRTNRDVLFDGTGPDVSEENLAPLRHAVGQGKANIGLATDGDADRFGIMDADGTWISPNHILALVYDYLVESRAWSLPAARSVATSHFIDAVAKSRGLGVLQTPVGFKYLGKLIEQDKIALGGEESAGLSIRGHIPEKDGILACLLVAEMTAARGATIGEQIRALFKKVGSEFWPLRTNLDLAEDVQQRTVLRLQRDYKEFLGRRVRTLDRTDGLKLEFEDGSWVLMRLSGTEPLLRVYTEASSKKASARLAEDARAWVYETAAKKGS
jgi:phosphoglucomutase